jgi:CBS domain-containing protein
MRDLEVPVERLMATRIEMVADTIPIAFAARLLLEQKISGVPVTTELGELVGVLSWHDVMRALGESGPRAVGVDGGPGAYYRDQAVIVGDIAPLESAQGIVRDFMSTRIVAVSVDATVGDAARLMAEADVHRVLVVDANDNLAGLITTLDVVRHVVGK